MDFRKILLYVIKKTEMSVQDLAKKANVTERSIQYYLKGERSPTLNTADKILKAAGVSLVIGKEEQKEAEPAK